MKPAEKKLVENELTEEELTEETVAAKRVYEGKIFSVDHDEVLLPNGRRSFRDIVRHHGGVCCAARNEKGELAFVMQYRYAYAKTLLELPAGKLEPGEDPFDAIKRELREEVGAQGVNWREMGFICPTPGYVDEIIRLYACDISSVGEACLDADEFLKLRFIPFEEALKMIDSGEIVDAKSIVLLLKLAREGL